MYGDQLTTMFWMSIRVKKKAEPATRTLIIQLCKIRLEFTGRCPFDLEFSSLRRSGYKSIISQRRIESTQNVSWKRNFHLSLNEKYFALPWAETMISSRSCVSVDGFVTGEYFVIIDKY